MSTIVVPRPDELPSERQSALRLVVAVLLAIWFLIVVTLGAAGAFVGLPGKPPLPIAMGIAAPLVLFFVWLRFSPAFRSFVLSLDLRLIAGMQAWRWAGFGFLTLYAHQILALVRQADFAAHRTFIRWNILGILDLVVAVSIGTASAFFTTGAPGEVSTAPMATLPLLLIPAFLVPFFLMLHATALMQSRQLIRKIRIRP